MMHALFIPLAPLTVGFPCDTWMLAQLPSAPIGEVGKWLLCLFGVIGIIAGLLHAWNEARKAFGRTPPLGDEVKANSKAADARFDELDRRRSQAIAGVYRHQNEQHETMRKEIIPRATLEKELQRIDAVALRVESVAGMVTDAKEEVLEAGDKRLKEMTTRLDRLDRHEAKHEERSRNTEHKIDSMESKIDSLLRDRGLPTKPRQHS